METAAMDVITTVKERKAHLALARTLTSIPTGAGREHRVIAWINEWIAQRRAHLTCQRDKYGNMLIGLKRAANARGPTVLLTGHLDHPAFVVQSILDARTIRLEFRGGINPLYLDRGRIVAYPGIALSQTHEHHHLAQPARGRIIEHAKGPIFDEVTVRFKYRVDDLQNGDLATWDLQRSFVKGRLFHAPACDDLAAVSAALCTLDLILSHTARRRQGRAPDVRILLTRAEEVGFIGAICACQSGLIPKHAKVLALENSRSFPHDSPIGAGPILRVGDRISIFSHALAYTVAQVAEELVRNDPTFKWQRKLMPGGACEATAYQAFGLDALCLCFALGNYHNMGDIDAVQAGVNTQQPRIAPEIISVDDYHGMIRLLAACAWKLGSKEPKTNNDAPADGAQAIRKRMEDIKARTGFILEERLSRV